MHRALIIGAGRIGAGYNWHDDEYTHAGAYRSFRGRVELGGFVEPDEKRREAASTKWNVPGYVTIDTAIAETQPDIVSVCTPPDHQAFAIQRLGDSVKAIWCEKPWMYGKTDLPVQVNYLRRGDPAHRQIAAALEKDDDEHHLFVVGKDDIHTRCHFEDLARWWGCKLHYLEFNGPCSYFLRARVVDGGWAEKFFGLGGISGGHCMRTMLTNLMDHVDLDTPLWSPSL